MLCVESGFMFDFPNDWKEDTILHDILLGQQPAMNLALFYGKYRG